MMPNAGIDAAGEPAGRLANPAGSGADVSTASILSFLSDGHAYPGHPPRVERIETHASYVFVAGDLVYKMKKPVRLGTADFTSLEARRRNCEHEVLLNQKLAPGIYLGVASLRQDKGSLSFDGNGAVVEWFVVMRRLDQDRLLDRLIVRREVVAADIDRLCDVLADFYAQAPRIEMEPAELIEWWRASVRRVELSLCDPLFELAPEMVMPSIRALRTFLDRDGDLIVARLIRGSIGDGHGDLRPEHIQLGQHPLLIDRLEFDDRLRRLDPFDEIVFLGLECERLGARWIGPRLLEGLEARLADTPPLELLRFYRCYGACLRASLSIEHLRDPVIRTPEKWPAQTRDYLDRAAAAFSHDFRRCD